MASDSASQARPEGRGVSRELNRRIACRPGPPRESGSGSDRTGRRRQPTGPNISGASSPIRSIVSRNSFAFASRAA